MSWPKTKFKTYIYTDGNNLYGYTIAKFLPTRLFKWTNSKKVDLNKYTSNRSKVCVVEIDAEYSKELRKLHNDYSLASDTTEIKKMLSYYQLKIDDFYNVSIVFFSIQLLCHEHARFTR